MATDSRSTEAREHRMTATCATCQHWKHEGQGNAARYGRCRANAPSAQSAAHSTEPAQWPITLETDGCGQHKGAPKPGAAPAARVESGQPVHDARQTRPAHTTGKRKATRRA
jgi:hypothetical protein